MLLKFSSLLAPPLLFIISSYTCYVTPYIHLITFRLINCRGECFLNIFSKQIAVDVKASYILTTYTTPGSFYIFIVTFNFTVTHADTPFFLNTHKIIPQHSQSYAQIRQIIQAHKLYTNSMHIRHSERWGGASIP